MNGEGTAGSGLDKHSGRSQRTGSCLKAVSHFLSAHPYLVLFILTVLVYNLNFRAINSADTLGASLLPFVILDTHAPWISAASPLIQSENIVSFIPSGDLLYPAYPIVTPVLVTPLYIIPYIIMKVLQIPLDMTNGTCFLIVYAMEKVAASIITAAAVVAFYAGMRKVVREKTAIVTAVILAFGTSMWSIMIFMRFTAPSLPTGASSATPRSTG